MGPHELGDRPRVVVAPDKFKGSLTAAQAAAALAAGVRRHRPGARIPALPLADGGEGTVDAAVAAGARSRCTLARAPWRAGCGPAGRCSRHPPAPPPR
ncbi:glycerate kinase [Kocuria nitroreducens]|uniref:glycerate kinase n=1 Tax=Kocuria nitroreducens TaxID=3058914 RepID=UPI0036D88076